MGVSNLPGSLELGVRPPQAPPPDEGYWDVYYILAFSNKRGGGGGGVFLIRTGFLGTIKGRGYFLMRRTFVIYKDATNSLPNLHQGVQTWPNEPQVSWFNTNILSRKKYQSSNPTTLIFDKTQSSSIQKWLSTLKKASRTWSFLINVNLLQTPIYEPRFLDPKKMNSRRDSQFHEGAEVMKCVCLCGVRGVWCVCGNRFWHGVAL